MSLCPCLRSPEVFRKIFRSVRRRFRKRFLFTGKPPSVARSVALLSVRSPPGGCSVAFRCSTLSRGHVALVDGPAKGGEHITSPERGFGGGEQEEDLGGFHIT